MPHKRSDRITKWTRFTQEQIEYGELVLPIEVTGILRSYDLEKKTAKDLHGHNYGSVTVFNQGKGPNSFTVVYKQAFQALQEQLTEKVRAEKEQEVLQTLVNDKKQRNEKTQRNKKKKRNEKSQHNEDQETASQTMEQPPQADSSGDSDKPTKLVPFDDPSRTWTNPNLPFALTEEWGAIAGGPAPKMSAEEEAERTEKILKECPTREKAEEFLAGKKKHIAEVWKTKQQQLAAIDEAQRKLKAQRDLELKVVRDAINKRKANEQAVRERNQKNNERYHKACETSEAEAGDDYVKMFEALDLGGGSDHIITRSEIEEINRVANAMQRTDAEYIELINIFDKGEPHLKLLSDPPSEYLDLFKDLSQPTLAKALEYIRQPHITERYGKVSSPKKPGKKPNKKSGKK